MKMIRIFLKGLLFFAGVLASAWIFMPWKQVGEGALLLAARQLDVTYSSVENSSKGLI